MIVEDGTGVEGANSYATEQEFDDYCDSHGITPTDGDTEAALVRGSSAIDNNYRAGFPGYRTFFRDQGLEWPRSGAYDIEYNQIGTQEIPIEVKYAAIEAAVRELAKPNSLEPDLARGGKISSLSAGSVSITYSGSANATTSFQKIDGIIARVLVPEAAYSMAGQVTRG